jgi:ATP-dependent DNA helicase RecG
VADLAADLALMQNAREEAEALLAADPSLSGWPLLKERVHRMFAERDDEAFN